MTEVGVFPEDPAIDRIAQMMARITHCLETRDVSLTTRHHAEESLSVFQKMAEDIYILRIQRDPRWTCVYEAETPQVPASGGGGSPGRTPVGSDEDLS